MDGGSVFLFCTALFVAAATPGPGIAAIVARVLGRGTNGALPFAFGVAIGDILWLTLAAGGLAIVAHTFHIIILIVKWIGVAYLVFLAWKMWTAPEAPRDIEIKTRDNSSAVFFLAGLSVTMGNPKVVVFYLALLPTLLDLTNISLLGYVELVFATLSVLALVFGAYITLAARARLLFTSRRALRIVNRSAATAMTGAAVWVATR